MICFNFIPWFRQWFRVLYRQTEAPELKRVMKSLKQRFYGNNDSFEYKEIIPKEIKLTDLNVGLSITLDHCGLLKLSFIFTAKVYPRIPLCPSLPADVLWGSFVTHWQTNPKGRLRGGYLCPSSGSFVPRFLPIRHPGLQYQGRHWRKASQARCSLSFSRKNNPFVSGALILL